MIMPWRMGNLPDIMREIKTKQNTIDEIEKNYQETLKERINALWVNIQVAENAVLPPIAKTKAMDHSAKLKLDALERKRRKLQKELEKMDIGEIPSLPTATYPLGWLRAKKIIEEPVKKIVEEPTGAALEVNLQDRERKADVAVIQNSRSGYPV